jgi:pyruvate dehydrogenase E1 component beta subunit
MREEMLRDGTVYLIGQEIGPFGGFFGVTKGLWEEFGEERIIETPVSESAIVGSCVGACMLDMRPVAEIMYADFLTCAMDSIVNSAAKARYASGGEINIPMVVRAAFGHRPRFGGDAEHMQNFEAWFAHVPGLKVVMPSTPYDAKGLLKSSIRDNNPVIFLEHMALYDTLAGPVPEEEYTVPLGEADVKREGKDVTLIATGAMVHQALAVADRLASEGISVEVVDPRTLRPLDSSALVASAKKTGRVVILHEAWITCGIGAEIAAQIAEQAFDELKSPVRRIGPLDSPAPMSPILKMTYLPDDAKVINTIKEML